MSEDELYVYSACCTWHGPISETKNIGRAGGVVEAAGRVSTVPPGEIPGCPHCGSPLFQVPSRTAWDEGTRNFAAQNPDVPHYSRWIQSLNSPCCPLQGWDWRAAYAEWVRTWKDGLELNYWTMAANLEEHRARLSMYLWAWGNYALPRVALEIGCGPLGGFLPLLRNSERRVGVDPLCDKYIQAGLLRPEEHPGIEFVAQRFEDWAATTSERFDAIFAADSLDHGDLGFHLLPRLAEMLLPMGRLYIHVHLRRPNQLDETHDHALTEEQLNKRLDAAREDHGIDLIQLRREIYLSDVTGEFPLNALVGVWERVR